MTPPQNLQGAPAKSAPPRYTPLQNPHPLYIDSFYILSKVIHIPPRYTPCKICEGGYPLQNPHPLFVHISTKIGDNSAGIGFAVQRAIKKTELLVSPVFLQTCIEIRSCS